MKIITLMAPLLAVSMAAACSLPTTAGSTAMKQERYLAAVESWRGAPINDLLATWPRAWVKDKIDMADGATTHTFIWTEDTFRQAEQSFDHANNEWVDESPAGAVLLICETRFITDAQGIITTVKPGNNHCGQTAITPPARTL